MRSVLLRICTTFLLFFEQFGLFVKKVAHLLVRTDEQGEKESWERLAGNGVGFVVLDDETAVALVVTFQNRLDQFSGLDLQVDTWRLQ